MGKRVIDDSTLTAIANKIRENVPDLSDAIITPLEMPEKIDVAYEKGKQAQYDEFWDKFQENGERTDYSYMFNGNWSADDFKPKHNMKLTSSLNMFLNFGITNGTRIDLRNIGVEIDFSNNIQMRSTFNYAYGITAIEKIVNNKSSSLDSMFTDCVNLHTIELLELNISCTLNNTFRYCGSLKNITIGGTIYQSLDIKWSPLTKESIISIVEHLSTTTTGKTLTLKKTAVNTAFGINVDDETTYPEDSEFYTLRHSKDNWTFSYA